MKREWERERERQAVGSEAAAVGWAYLVWVIALRLLTLINCLETQ